MLLSIAVSTDAPALAHAQSAARAGVELRPLAPGASIAIGERRVLQSSILGGTRELLIGTPASYDKSTDRYPVLVVLDGEENFLTVVSAVRALSRSGRMPETLVVGVVNVDRERDFTPALRKTTELPPGISRIGRANAFLDFLAEELLPSIDATYRTRPLRILVGHSLGGLLAMHAFASRPELFRMYLTVEPSLWWDARSPVDQLFETFRSHPSLVARLVSAEGSSEEGWRHDWSGLLAAVPKGVWTELVPIDGETHQNLMYRSSYSGLIALFHDYSPASSHDLSLASLNALDTQYSRLSRDFNYPVPIPLGALLDLADREQNQRRFASAQAALTRARKLYPSSQVIGTWQATLDTLAADARTRNLHATEDAVHFTPVSAADARPLLGHWHAAANSTSPSAEADFSLAGDTMVVRILVHGIAGDGGDLRLPPAIVELRARTIRFERENRGGGHTVSTLTLYGDGRLRGSEELVGGRPIPKGFTVPKTILEFSKR